MNSAVLNASFTKSFAARLDDIPKWAWWALALAVITVRSWAAPGAGIFGNPGDADDATRLLQVRELLANGHWFDTTTYKMGGDAGMLSHWSRLIDLPLAAIITTAGLFTSTENAERLAHILWPTATLAAVLWVAFRATAKVAGETAGRFLLFASVISPFALYQFAVGRIDHHNVMIAGIVSAALLIWAYPGCTRMWRVAGALTGLALAIGYEALAPAVAIGVFVTLWALLDRRVESAGGGFALALAATFALAFAATIPPSRWMDIRCDAISLNMVALIAFSTGGFALAVGPARSWPLGARLALMAGMAAVGLIIFGALEPKCLAGPTGQVPPLANKLWLQDVAEGNSILAQMISRNVEHSLGLFIFFVIGAVASARLAWQSRTAADIFLFVIVVTFAAFACWQYKFMSYGTLVALVPIAIMISRLGAIGEVGAPIVRLAALLASSQAFLLVLSESADSAIGKPRIITETMINTAGSCGKPDAVRDLDAIPPGLMAAHLDIAASIAALTRHRVLAAPYHRIADAIIANHELFSATDPAVAAAILKRENVDYVVVCQGVDGPYKLNPAWKNSLRVELTQGVAPGYLSPVALANPTTTYRVYKVNRAALSLPPSKAAASSP